MLKSFGVAYRGYMAWKFERLLQKAEAHGMTEEELCNSDQRFALFMRVGRAFETCSEREVVDYIADAMVGGVKCGDADAKPDFAQMALSSLSGATKVELDILLLLRKHQRYTLNVGEVEDKEKINEYVDECCHALGIDSLMLASLSHSMARTGLVTPTSSGWGGLVNHTNTLTPLARQLFHYVDYSRRLTL